MSTEADDSSAEGSVPLKFSDFLENQHPSVLRDVENASHVYQSSYGKRRALNTPDLRLHCEICEGVRTFRTADRPVFELDVREDYVQMTYTCGDCHEQTKLYSLYMVFGADNRGNAYKFGELPPFGVPVPARVLRLFGKDSKIFLKGRQCENQGMGVGAFAYYRRVVENHKNDILDEIIKVCDTVGATDVIPELENAKLEISFTKAMEQIKLALPQGLLVNGHNPLTALHGALSVGLHTESDADCLAAAQAVRVVLADLVERISLLKQDNQELQNAVQLLLAKKAQNSSI